MEHWLELPIVMRNGDALVIYGWLTILTVGTLWHKHSGKTQDKPSTSGRVPYDDR